MTLDEAIRHVRKLLTTDWKGVDRDAIALLLEHAEAGQAQATDSHYRPNADVMRRLAERLQAGPAWLANNLRDFDWGAGAPPRPAANVPTLRDQFAMHAPMAPLPDGMGGNAAEREILRNRARVALAYADAMLAARGTK